MSKELQLKDVEGIGPAAVKKLKDSKIETVQDLATQSIESLTESVGLSKDLANKYIQNAHKLLRENDQIGPEFVDGNEALVKREAIERVKTGSAKLDEFLYGGFETQAITELYGEFGSGKSQLCHALAVQCSKQLKDGGLGANTRCIYIDTEGTFRPERIKQMAMQQELDPQYVLRNIKICKVYNSGHLETIMENLSTYVKEFNARMIVVDSIIALHRADYTGRGTLADRQQKIQAIMHRLLRLAEIYGLVIVITNQVTTSPDTFFGDPTKPTGGNIIGHNSTYRIYLRKSGKNRLIKMIDSPYHDSLDIKIQITPKGIEDAAE